MSVTRNQRRLRAFALVLATVIFLAAGALPTCAEGLCCATAEHATVHAQMPCCEQTSMKPGDALRLQPATPAGVTSSPHTPVAVLVRSETSVVHARVQVMPARGTSAAHHEPSPPLFLLNAQFLI